MRQKRILALLLALVMLLGLAACGKKSSGEDTGQKEKDYEAMDPAELVGAWRMVAWSLTDDTSYTKAEDSYMVFSASDLKYYSAGALMTDSNYTFADEESILLVAKNDPNNKVGWVIHKTGENIRKRRGFCPATSRSCSPCSTVHRPPTARGLPETRKRSVPSASECAATGQPLPEPASPMSLVSWSGRLMMKRTAGLWSLTQKISFFVIRSRLSGIATKESKASCSEKHIIFRR